MSWASEYRRAAELGKAPRVVRVRGCNGRPRSEVKRGLVKTPFGYSRPKDVADWETRRARTAAG